MSEINQKTTIPIGWAISIVAAIVGLAFEAGITQSRFNTLEREYEETKQAKVISDKVSQEQQLAIQRLDLTLGNISDRLDSIDRKLDRIDRTEKR